MCCDLWQESEGLRNKYLDVYLPARRQRKGEEEPLDPLPQQIQRPQLAFLHCPIVDLSVPTHQQYAFYFTTHQPLDPLSYAAS